MLTVSLAEFRAAIEAQRVPREHWAVRCPICGTVQSIRDLIDAGAGHDYTAVRGFFGFSCIGRWTGAGQHRRGWPPGRGCSWTLGGTLPIHTYEVILPSGEVHPLFEPVTAADAQLHMKRHLQRGTGLALPPRLLAQSRPRVTAHTHQQSLSL